MEWNELVFEHLVFVSMTTTTTTTTKTTRERTLTTRTLSLLKKPTGAESIRENAENHGIFTHGRGARTTRFRRRVRGGKREALVGR